MGIWGRREHEEKSQPPPPTFLPSELMGWFEPPNDPGGAVGAVHDDGLVEQYPLRRLLPRCGGERTDAPEQPPTPLHATSTMATGGGEGERAPMFEIPVYQTRHPLPLRKTETRGQVPTGEGGGGVEGKATAVGEGDVLVVDEDGGVGALGLADW